MKFRLEDDSIIDTHSSFSSMVVLNPEAYPVKSVMTYVGKGVGFELQADGSETEYYKGKNANTSDDWFYVAAIDGWLEIPVEHSKIGDNYILIEIKEKSND